MIFAYNKKTDHLWFQIFATFSFFFFWGRDLVFPPRVSGFKPHGTLESLGRTKSDDGCDDDDWADFCWLHQGWLDPCCSKSIPGSIWNIKKRNTGTPPSHGENPPMNGKVKPPFSDARCRRDPRFKRIVDVGAGTGRMASWLTNWNLEAAKRICESVGWILRDIHWVVPPPRKNGTTRIITFLGSGIPTSTFICHRHPGRGDNPTVMQLVGRIVLDLDNSGFLDSSASDDEFLP